MSAAASRRRFSASRRSADGGPPASRPSGTGCGAATARPPDRRLRAGTSSWMVSRVATCGVMGADPTGGPRLALPDLSGTVRISAVRPDPRSHRRARPGGPHPAGPPARRSPVPGNKGPVRWSRNGWRIRGLADGIRSALTGTSAGDAGCPCPGLRGSTARMTVTADLDQLSIDTIRTLAIDAVQAANSGHPGLPLAMAPTAYLLYTRVMEHDPQDPTWPDRDRFVLSAGHGSMLLYATLHLSGYDLPLEELERFRQWGSLTPGHPERDKVHVTPGVEVTTGPLGQGFANGVGMAMAERFLRSRYGADLQDHHIFAIVSDGDLMEGIASEAASLAGHLGLGRLVYLYDDNDISLDGPTSLSFQTEDVTKRFEAYGWHVLEVHDAHDITAIEAAITDGRRVDTQPTLIRIKSIIGYP